MALSDIAAGIEVTTEQRERGIATVDDVGGELCDRFAGRADALPCTPAAAATVLDHHESGVSVGESARAAAVAPMTAAKALHRCGISGISPFAPTARRIVRDWLAGELSRSDALELTGGDEAEFALAAYVEAHDPIPELVEAAESAHRLTGNACVEKRDALAETMTDAADLR